MSLPGIAWEFLVPLFAGLVVWAITWGVLVLLKTKFRGPSVFLLFVMAVLGTFLAGALYDILMPLLNPWAPYHLNIFSPLEAFAAGIVFLFFYYLLLLRFVLRVKLHNALIVSLVAVFATLLGLALSERLVLFIAMSLP